MAAKATIAAATMSTTPTGAHSLSMNSASSRPPTAILPSSFLRFPKSGDPMKIAKVPLNAPWLHWYRIRMCRREPLGQIVGPKLLNVRDAVRRFRKTTARLGKNQLSRCGRPARSSRWHLAAPATEAVLGLLTGAGKQRASF
jgi:hypothetical protein